MVENFVWIIDSLRLDISFYAFQNTGTFLALHLTLMKKVICYLEALLLRNLLFECI